MRRRGDGSERTASAAVNGNSRPISRLGFGGTGADENETSTVIVAIDEDLWTVKECNCQLKQRHVHDDLYIGSNQLNVHGCKKAREKSQSSREDVSECGEWEKVHVMIELPKV